MFFVIFPLITIPIGKYIKGLFLQTFWNTRLSTEHKRICDQFDSNCVVFDCCAGVGPFVLPAARRRIRAIYANDLNPDCIYFLKENIKINKVCCRKLFFQSCVLLDSFNK